MECSHGQIGRVWVQECDRLRDLSRRTLAWVQKGKETEQLDCIYQLMSRGGVAIGNANSAEEMWGAIASYPFFEQFEWEIEPLVDLGFVLNSAIERLK